MPLFSRNLENKYYVGVRVWVIRILMSHYLSLKLESNISITSSKVIFGKCYIVPNVHSLWYVRDV